MTVIVCISDGGGMLFNNRRQSKDSLLIENVSLLVGDGTLYVSSFSERLFENSSLCTIVASDPLKTADREDFVFVENLLLLEYKEKIDRLVIYKWNRLYPFDFRLDINPQKEGMKLCDVLEFEGSSHKKITREIWER